MKPPRPLQDGPTLRLYEFFENNPDEELTVDDAALKFDVPKCKVYHSVSVLAKRMSGLELVSVIRRAK